MTVKRIVLLNLAHHYHLLCASDLLHLSSLFSIALLALFHFKRVFKRILMTGCYLLPAAVLLIVYLPTSDLLAGEPPEFGLERVGELFASLIGMHVLIAYTEASELALYCNSLSILILLVVTTLLAKQERYYSRTGWTKSISLPRYRRTARTLFYPAKFYWSRWLGQ